ncbi:MAG: hypothetical protein J3Q66DRAFT_367497 [Benniella sp.]|nr:MAG: hypothetical protein J3Q66DRAFT_367497 [Benniella sp.]
MHPMQLGSLLPQQQHLSSQYPSQVSTTESQPRIEQPSFQYTTQLQFAQNQQQQIAYLQQQQHIQQVVASQDGPAFQEPVPSANSLWMSMQPWNPSSTVHSECNPEQGYRVCWSPTSQDFILTTVDCNRFEAEYLDRVEISSRDKSPRGSQKRLTEEEKDQIREYHKNHPNTPYSMLGQLFGCSKSTAHRTINPSPETAVDKAPCYR